MTYYWHYSFLVFKLFWVWWVSHLSSWLVSFWEDPINLSTFSFMAQQMFALCFLCLGPRNSHLSKEMIYWEMISKSQDFGDKCGKSVRFFSGQSLGYIPGVHRGTSHSNPIAQVLPLFNPFITLYSPPTVTIMVLININKFITIHTKEC